MKFIPLYTFLLAAVFTCQTASATLILSDNFNTANDLNDDLGSRQGGTAATQDWITDGRGTVSIVNNRLNLDDGGGNDDINAAVDYDFAGDPDLLDFGEFTVSFDLDPSSPGNYSYFGLGHGTLVGDRAAIDPAGDFGILTSASGRLNVRAGGSTVSDQSNGLSYNTGLNAVELTVTTTAFSSGTAFTVGMTLNGGTVDLDPNTGANTFSSTWDAGGTNYIWLSDRGAVSEFDNFEVAAVPEPATAALFAGALAVVGALGRWSRRV